jgi:hypothetical protein
MAVDAPALLHELASTWRELGQEHSTGVLRACAMTLIVAAAEHDDPQELGALLARVMQRHPSRIIVLRACPRHTGIDARTSVQCWMPTGRARQICGEWIEISAGVARLAEVVPLLLGLTVPDLPVVFWMRHTALAHARALDAVLPLATRVIVDTSEALDAASALAAVRHLATGEWRLADLAWSRITRWRKALAGLLDASARPSRGAIRWAGERMSMPACYLDAWLRTVYADLDVELGSCDPVMPPSRVGRIRQVTLQGSELDLQLARPSGGANVTTQLNGWSGGLVFPSLDEVELLDAELGISGRDTRFEAALAHARSL